jgi:hypothetical protein
MAPRTKNTAATEVDDVHVESTESESKKRSQVEIWSPKDLNKELKEIQDTLKQGVKGIDVLPPNEKYTREVAACAQEILDDIARFKKGYTELYGGTKTKKSSSLKPRLCDKKLGKFAQEEFGVTLPSVNGFVVSETNALAPRMISLYVKKHNLNRKQFFELDDKLHALFNSPSINDHTRTYLDLTKARIAEKAAERTEPNESNSVAAVYCENGVYSMNYSALKIALSKFVVQSDDVLDEKLYEDELKAFADKLGQEHQEREELEKAKKQKK